MKGHPVFILIIFFSIFTSTPYPQVPGKGIENFNISTQTNLSLSIEASDQLNENKKIVFCFGTLELIQPVDEKIMALFSGYSAYEENARRTRTRINSLHHQISLKIDWTAGKMEVYLRDSCVTPVPVSFNIKEFPGTGLKRISFYGSSVYAYAEFLLDSFAGEIYAVPHHHLDQGFHLNRDYVWAVKMEEWEEDFEKRGLK